MDDVKIKKDIIQNNNRNPTKNKNNTLTTHNKVTSFSNVYPDQSTILSNYNSLLCTESITTNPVTSNIVIDAICYDQLLLTNNKPK